MAQTKKLLPKNPLIIANIFLSLILFTLTFHFFIRPIIVSPPPDKALVKKEAQKIADNCQGYGNTKRKCYEENLGKLAQSMGFTYAEQTLYTVQTIDPFTRTCHVIAHRIASWAMRKDPNSWKVLLGEVNTTACGGGFLHGVLEAHLGSNPDFKIDAAVIDEFCPSDSRYKKQLCAHLLGHYLLFQKDEKLDDALTTCNGVRDDFMRFWCFNGVFMEDHQKVLAVEHGLVKPFKFTDTYAQTLAKRCNTFDQTESRACWMEIPEIFSKVYGLTYDKDKVFALCNQAKTEESQEACYNKGVTLLLINPYASSGKIKGVCDPHEKDKTLFEKCLHDRINDLITTSVMFADRGVVLCSNVADEGSKKDCFTYLGDWFKRLNIPLNEREDLCKDAPDQYKKLCRG